MATDPHNPPEVQNSRITLVTYTLISLYFLPLLVIAVAAGISDEFSSNSNAVDFMVSVANVYLGDARNAMGTFVVPFITAYSISSWNKGTGLSTEASILFLFLVFMFIASVLTYALVDTRIEQILKNMTIVDQVQIDRTRQTLTNITSSYVKESLAYISLLLGISQNKDGNSTVTKTK